MNYLIDFILHIDSHLIVLVNSFGNWTYLILFLLVFVETGAVILPFLPGDSLLFAACALSANKNFQLNIWLLIVLFLLAPILGDSLNFLIGTHFGKALLKSSFFKRVVKQDYLDKTRNFFANHGSTSISIARFMPIVRTFAPLIAGSSGLLYKKFIGYNLLGAFLWVMICCGAGYFFGNFPFVKEHFTLIILGVIFISFIPSIFSILRAKFKTA